MKRIIKKISKKEFIKIFLSVLFICLLYISTAIPPIPTEFYGTATWLDLNNSPLSVGTKIDVYAGNISCGSFSIINPGYYGVLTCLGDDNYTNKIEGAVFGQNIIFKINNETALTIGDTVWYSDFYGLNYQMVNITPNPRCGNGHCEITENCIVCQEDCGKCPSNQSGTGSGSGNATGSTEGSASAGGGGASAGGGTGGGTGGYATGSAEGLGNQNLTSAYCQEDWLCSEWFPEECPITEIQNRECFDRNNCTTEFLKPELNRTCIYLGTCFDLLRNQDETDVDCGGLKCKPCDLGKKCLFDYDCKSGFCNPTKNICEEPTCNDGFKNQGEEQIDCGGPCQPCEKPSLEKPSTIAIFLAKGCGDFPWLFVLLASVFSLLIYLIGKAYTLKIKNSKEFKKLRKIEQLIKIYDLNRNLKVFILIIILLEIAVSMYLYYFCEIEVWIFLMILIIIPLIIYVIIKNYVYDEKRKKNKLRKTILEHEDYLEKLIKIEFEEIRKEEIKALNILNYINYKNIDKNLAVCLKDIRFSIMELHNNKSKYPIESQDYLINTIEEINNYQFNDDSDENKKLNNLKRSLLLIQKTHKDILLQYKKLREEKEVEEELNNEFKDNKENSQIDTKKNTQDEKQDKENINKE